MRPYRIRVRYGSPDRALMCMPFAGGSIASMTEVPQQAGLLSRDVHANAPPTNTSASEINTEDGNDPA